MIIFFNGTCETKIDKNGNKPVMYMSTWKYINFWLFKLSFNYELYYISDDKTHKLNYGKHLSEIDLSWGWN